MNICFAKKTDKYDLKDQDLLIKVIEQIAEISSLHTLVPSSDLVLSVILLDDPQITEINEQYLNHEGPTDVISFDYVDDFDEEIDADDEFTIGELYISLETAKRQGEEYNKTLNEELLLYIAHGILHICGYDDHCEEDINEMRQAEQRVLSELNKVMGTVEVI
ncbi:MAG: rRNA maturation RNase YbeY [Lentisphaerales bacterium]|nr:rRNA maturation RNase YbeY [Lentisphaerales bacterium]